MRGLLLTIPVSLVLGGCRLTDVEIVPSPEVVVAAVTAVLNVDDPLEPSQLELSIVALIARSHREISYEIPGATVRISGEHGQSIRLEEVADPRSTCLTKLAGGLRRPPAGSCHIGRMRPSPFSPGELLTLEVTLPDGGVLAGVSRLPGFFAPSGLSLSNGRCRLEPDTGYNFSWPRVLGAGTFLAEARVAGLGELWTNDEPLYLPATLRGPDHTNMIFPRDFLYELINRDEWELQRVLYTGLPEGASADVTIGAVDRNWANWIRVRFAFEGEIRIPSVFGDGTGWFGTGVRWKVSVESRAAGDANELPSCGAVGG